MPARTWFITGCSSGLGRALAARLLIAGHRVAATARSPETLKALEPLAGGGDRLWTGRLDVTDGEEIRRRVDEAFSALVRIDVIVSNAGYGLFGAAEEATDEQVQHQLATNLLGPIRLARAALPHLRTQGSGRIMQISSMGGQTAMPGFSAYNASKWGVEGFFEALADEVAGFGIGVSIVEPGSVRTAFTGSSRVTASPSPAYARTRVGVLRRAMDRGLVPHTGGLDQMVDAIIASAGHEPAPRRLVLGSDAHRGICEALTHRLADVTAQRDLAYSTDLDRPAR
jgi:NAD(P)-dependent dehydrogenase (short-subunit alcohol dehydrogenase family)